ncbi:tyrosine-type recombinase/integrase [Paragemmobacter straminiformis]|uniref:Site-specific integrase n=1 Tax=Paragemmobacter straminiformis TaxID=2045119 RepID=A0A842I9Y6_9RHOB|nr:site-specific integrase [Gemmobacter straminiformis]MBC2836167.1 site-specific integrase [Gemmobacter straminiformis]
MGILEVFKRNLTRIEDQPPPLADPTLAEFFDNRYIGYANITKRRPELDRLVFNKHIRASLGHFKINQLTTQILDDWVSIHIGKNYKPGTINKHINYLKRVLNVARTWGVLRKSKEELRISIRIPMGDPKQRFLSSEEVMRLIRSCETENHPYLGLFVNLLILTGARSSEARLAKWGEFDLVRRVWTVPISKNGRARRIILNDAAVRLLDDIRLRTATLGFGIAADDYLFMNPHLKKPYQSFHLAWDRVRTRLNMREVRIHDLRHTYASFLINHGATIYEVQKLLGHHHISMTERYAHLYPDTLQQRVELISHALAGQ